MFEQMLLVLQVLKYVNNHFIPPMASGIGINILGS